MTVRDSKWTDLMTYCNNEWITDFHYERLMNKMLNPTLQSASAEETDRLLVSGSINLGTDEVWLDPFSLFDDMVELETRLPGEFAIVLADELGVRLATYPFTPKSQHVEDSSAGVACGTVGSGAVAVEPAQIFELVPWDPDTTEVSIWHSDTKIASRWVTANAPWVEVSSPNGGDIVDGDTLHISWSAGDPDGDDLAYTILYSADEGQSWITLAADIENSSYQANAGLLAGSTQALVKVIATDGVNTGEDISDAQFTVTNRAPQVSILAPLAGSVHSLEDVIALAADVYDPEQIPIVDEDVIWESDRDGALGTGTSVILSATSLSWGRHEFTVGAQDDGGLQDQASVVVYVGERIFVPMILRG